jgi:hypothetical protein
MGRLLTSSANSGALGERRGCGGASGRRRRAPAAQETLRWARTGQTREGKGKPTGVPSSWRRGGTHRGKRRGAGSTTVAERTIVSGAGTRARAWRKAPTGLAHEATGGREGACGLASTGGTRLSDTEGTRARLGWLGWNGFSYFQGISNVFYIYFL